MKQEEKELNGKNLMVGDWVVYEGDTNYDNPIRIEGMDIATKSLITSDREDVGFDGIEPIPLTAEILEKNGFKKHNRYQYIYKDNYCKVCVSFAPRIEIDGMDLGEPPINISIEGALFDINMNMSAIHELQHALRLCGITHEIVL